MRATFQRPEIKSVGVRVGEITGLAFQVKSVADQCSLKMPIHRFDLGRFDEMGIHDRD